MPPSEKLSRILSLEFGYFVVLGIFGLLLGVVLLFGISLLAAWIHGLLSGELTLERGGKSRRVFKWTFWLLFWGLPVLGLRWLLAEL